MARITTGLTVELLDALPDDVAAHLRWKVDAFTLARVRVEERRERVAQWVLDVQQQWGSCGRVALWDGRPVGSLLYAPPAFLPGVVEVPTAPASRDSVVVCSLHVEPGRRRGGVARMLVQSAAADLVGRDVRALEAFAARLPVAKACGVTVPEAMLESVGFREARSHPVTPRMRMDLRGTRSWMDDVERAVARAVGAVRPAEPGTRPAAVPDTRSGTAAGARSG